MEILLLLGVVGTSLLLKKITKSDIQSLHYIRNSTDVSNFDSKALWEHKINTWYSDSQLDSELKEYGYSELTGDDTSYDYKIQKLAEIKSAHGCDTRYY